MWRVWVEEVKAEAGAELTSDMWGGVRGQLGAESAIVTSLLSQCHITTESVTAEQHNVNAGLLLTNIHICGTQPNN